MDMGVLTRGRAAFERRMRGSCKIERIGKPEPDGHGGSTTPRETIFEGKCYLRYPGLAFESNFDSAGVTVAQSRIVLRVPFGPTFRPGDVVTILTDPDNPQLVDTVLRIASIDDQSQSTAQRLLCEDNQSGVPNG